ncbi:MAG: 1-deoxy-D-xylulose-5-phosphate reductoisomerase [Chthoniobacterales bacterium]
MPETAKRTKRIVILGASGSIGQSAQKIIRQLSPRFQLLGASCHSSTQVLEKITHEFTPAVVCLSDTTAPNPSLPANTRLLRGSDGLEELATLPEADLILISIIGIGGLRPALAAIEAGKDIAVASKEILVMAGGIVMSRAKERGVKVLPVDSEHNAIFQCLDGKNKATTDISRLILTCSGGPFRQLPAEKLQHVTPAQALKHPTWKMGTKITIDSATLFNKGLEMLEAHWLFDTPMSRIEAIIHPQSIIHSLVEFIDGSLLAQLSHTDMAFPIQYAFTWPERIPGTLPSLDLARLATLEFSAPRHDAFPALRLAHEAGTKGGSFPAVLNAANEIAVAAFLDNKIPFPDIWRIVEKTLPLTAHADAKTLDQLIRDDQAARKAASELIHSTT